MRRKPPRQAPTRYLAVENKLPLKPEEAFSEDILSVHLWALNLDGVYRRCTRRECRRFQSCMSPTATPRLDCRGRPGPKVEARTEGMELLVRRLLSGRGFPASTIPRQQPKR